MSNASDMMAISPYELQFSTNQVVLLESIAANNQHSLGIFGPVLRILSSISPAEQRVFVSLLLSYPLASCLWSLPTKSQNLKHVFVAIVSIGYVVFIFDCFSALATLLFDCVATYLMAKFIRRPSMPWIVIAFLMSHLLLMRLLSMLEGRNDPWAVDVSIAQMVLVKKLSTFAWNVHDGNQDPSRLSDFQRKNAIAIPKPLAYISYALFFPTMFAGPSFEYAEYAKFIDHSMFEKNASNAKDLQSECEKAGCKKLIYGCIWLSLSLAKFKVSSLQYLLGSEFASQLFLGKLVSLHLFTVITRFKYYAIWELVDGACILSGFGYSGTDHKTQKSVWNRLENVQPLNVELAQNAHAYVGNWNIHTHRWLKNYIYLRFSTPGEKPGFEATMTTFFFSALWHGLYPGYFMTFIMGGLLSAVASEARRYLRPLVLKLSTRNAWAKGVYDLISLVSTQLSFDFAVLPFMALSVSSTMAIWGQVSYYVLWGLFLAFSLLTLFKPMGPASQRALELLLSGRKPLCPRTIATIWRPQLRC